MRTGLESRTLPEPWSGVPDMLRRRGLRWTPQRRLLIEVLSSLTGHVTTADLVDRCRRADSATIPSTVYRTLDVLEDLGLIRHCHGADGREEYHILPASEHGHLYCEACGAVEEIPAETAADLAAELQARHDFSVDLSHVTFVGRCPSCREAPAK